MPGAIAGDIIGSSHEGRSAGLESFTFFTSRSQFTDDTVLTVAVADAILNNKPYAVAIREWGLRYPNAGYGHQFYEWLHAPTDPGPYNSFGNGSAMRVSPVAWAFNEWGEVAQTAAATAAVTHNHPEGIKGAQAVACAILLARKKTSKDAIALILRESFKYDLLAARKSLTEGAIARSTCQETVPAAAVAFIESKDFADAIRHAVWFGGDTDTTACIAGAVAEAFYGGISPEIEREVRSRLDKPMLQIVDTFTSRYCKSKPKLALVSTKR